MIKKYWKDALAILVLIISVTSVFWWVPQVYFQQDEWFSIGLAMLTKTDPSVFFRITSSIHFTPVAQLWFAVQYALFGLHAGNFGMVSMASHMIVIILAYIVLRKLSVSTVPAYIGMTFFALNPVSAQVVSWISASDLAGPSVILFLSGCIIWIWNSPGKPLYADSVAGILLFCAMLAKEDLILGYIAIFILWLCFDRKRTLSYKPIVVSFVAWLLTYASIWSFGPKADGVKNNRSVIDSISYLTSIPRWMGKIIVTHDTVRMVFQRLTGRYASYFPFIDSDPIIKTFSAMMGILWYGWYITIMLIKKVPVKKILFFPILTAIALTPYYFSFSTEPESRHYYIPVLIMSIGIAQYLDWAIRNTYRSVAIISILFFTLLSVSYVIGNQPPNDYIPFQKKREVIATELGKITAPSPSSVVYLIENAGKLPFQSGVGQMLIVLQARRDTALYPYISANFLWGLFDQGFKKVGEKGFGYYYDVNVLEADFHKGLFDVSHIRAYRFNPDTSDFHDITQEIVQDIMVQ